MAELKLGKITQYDRDMLDLTLIKNPYIPDKIKKGVLDYPKQLKSLIYLNRPVGNKYHRILIGGEAYGGKTLLGAVLALRFIHLKGFKGLVTRKNYDDLTEESVDSIYGYIGLWNDLLPKKQQLKIRSLPPKIKSNEGGILSFRAFDHISKKEKTRSKTYQCIYNDEAPEIERQILTFQGRSLRQDKTSRFPKAIVNFGNPQFDPKTFVLNESSKRFLEEYVKGKYVYVPMGFNDNPHINKKEVEASFEDLDEIDKQSQQFGNWEYEYQKGSLINLNKIKELLQPQTSNRSASILGIDLAGRGEDKFAVSTLTIDLKTNQVMIDNISQTIGVERETLVEKHVMEDHKRGVYPSFCILEMEGGSWMDTETHWKNFFNQLGIQVKAKQPVGSKFNRARPLVRQMRQGHVLINQCLENKKYPESKYKETYFELLKNEIMRLAPVMPISPNIIDSLSIAFNYLRKIKIKG